MGCEPLLRVQNLSTAIKSPTGSLPIVEHVSLEVNAGEAVALVGESGSGKSMTALSLMRLLQHPAHISSGSIQFEGQELLHLRERALHRLRGGRLAMIFQDPMTYLNPLMKVGDQIAEAVILHQSLGRAKARAAALEALRRVHIPAPESVLDRYPHQISGGMRQRVLIAMAISSNPALLIADEPTTALDVTVQAQIMRLLAEVRREIGSAMLLITHDLGLVAEFCDRVLVMYAGQIVEEGDVYSIFASPQHPYTRALLRSTLPLHRRVENFSAIEGHPPNPSFLPKGCRFQPRCTEAIARCALEQPPSFELSSSGTARCWLRQSAKVRHAPAS